MNANNYELTKELHKPIIRKFKKRMVYSRFRDNIWGADLADMQFISKFKACARYFLTNFYLSPNDSPSKTMKMFFISYKKLFSFWRYLIFCVSIFPSFSPYQTLL